MVLNAIQFQLLSAHLNQYLFSNQQFKSLTCSQAILVLRSIIEDRLYYENCQQSFFLEGGLIDSVDHIRTILQHDCPQNVTRTTDIQYSNGSVPDGFVAYVNYHGEVTIEPQGLLDLSDKNDGDCEPVSKADVFKFISARIIDVLTEKMLTRKKEELMEQRQSQVAVDEYWSIISPSSPNGSPTSPVAEFSFNSSQSSVGGSPSTGSAITKRLPPVPEGLNNRNRPISTRVDANTHSRRGSNIPPVPKHLAMNRAPPILNMPPPINKDKLKKPVKQFWEKPCILIVGDSGTGKSSLINTIFGTDEQIGVGKPVTQEMNVIEKESLILIDSKGFERESEGDDAMRKLNEFLSSRTFHSKIHMVWYVIASDSARVQDCVKEVCFKYFSDIPTFFVLTKCDKVTPRNLQIMRKAIEMLQISTMAGIFAVSDRPPVILDYPRLCPRCPDTNMEPIFNKNQYPQMITCSCCKHVTSACKYCDRARLLLDTTEQNWFCKGCKNEWEQLTTAESDLDELIVSTYHKFTLINDEYAVLFRKSLRTRHLKLIATGVAGAVGVGITGAIMGASVGGLVGAAVGMVGGTIAGAAMGAGTASSYVQDPYKKMKPTAPISTSNTRK